MTKLSVNLNRIAPLRNARELGTPSMITAAKTAIKAGADGITVHPRPDQRHTRYSDVYDLSDMLKAEHSDIEFNIEGNPFTGSYLDIVCDVRPAQATLVPDSPDANTSDHGWNLAENKDALKIIIKKLKSHNIRVSLFIDADSDEIAIAKQISADRIELYTEPYAKAYLLRNDIDIIAKLFAKTSQEAFDAGLGINAGHDLNLENLQFFCENVPNIMEVSIGQALVVDSLEMGLYNATKEYVKILSELKNQE